jgi:hypothetical protein
LVEAAPHGGPRYVGRRHIARQRPGEGRSVLCIWRSRSASGGRRTPRPPTGSIWIVSAPGLFAAKTPADEGWFRWASLARIQIIGLCGKPEEFSLGAFLAFGRINPCMYVYIHCRGIQRTAMIWRE